MSNPLWVVETAATFWSRAGGPEPYPRALRVAITRSLPVSVVFLTRPHIAGVNRWLERNLGERATLVADRPLRACLVARLGSGVILVDGTDSEDEQRFSLAHELSHFLRDYWRPRARARARLGEGALDVLDGLREPTPSERIRAALTCVELAPRVHLMERTADGHLPDAAIDESEVAADRLAFELLAPADELLEEVDALPAPERRPAAERLLAQRYGLSPGPATSYAVQLVPAAPRVTSVLRRLRRI